jgi:hypothetical protein
MQKVSSWLNTFKLARHFTCYQGTQGSLPRAWSIQTKCLGEEDAIITIISIILVIYKRYSFYVIVLLGPQLFPEVS